MRTNSRLSKPATAPKTSAPKTKSKAEPAKAKASEKEQTRGWQAKATKRPAAKAQPKKAEQAPPKQAQASKPETNNDYVTITSPVMHPNNPDLLIGYERVQVPRSEVSRDSGQWGGSDGGFYA